MRDFPGMPDALLKLERRKLIAAGLAAPEQVGLMIPVDPVPGRTIESMTREDARNVVGTLLTQAMARGGKSKNTATS